MLEPPAASRLVTPKTLVRCLDCLKGSEPASPPFEVSHREIERPALPMATLASVSNVIGGAPLPLPCEHKVHSSGRGLPMKALSRHRVRASRQSAVLEVRRTFLPPPYGLAGT